ncbi:hypothetical protein [Paractinoplanes lichenicola]|uniref:DUF2397 domain-containing protein n=1 Tax=Paractinoplanes lichenicola TaxID=2802976 RepID=A0ABS1VQN8_9ACTN|nr:hypothetical protein [Actinoplanes lichenicola]MBL7256515.1 hypothetical protein [Actinoplanes lichenicola]
MTDPAALTFDDFAAETAVLGIYRQVFAVLAKEANGMVDDAASVAADEAIFTAFAGAGPAGLTVEQVVFACGGLPAERVRRRFEVLRSYRAVTRVNERPHEMFYQATFAPYVMLLFLRRLSQTGGQAELHRMLSMARLALDDAETTAAVVREQLAEMTTVFRLLSNPIMQLAKSASVESLQAQAQPLLGNSELLDKARLFHNAAADRWPELLPECTRLRMALAAYRDSLNTAAGRLLAHAGKTRALGLLPTERWRTFAREGSTEELAGALDGLLFDAPEPLFTVDELLEAVEEGLHAEAGRVPPPRPRTDEEPPAADPDDDPQVRQLTMRAEELLGDRAEATVAQLLAEAGDWAAGRRVLSDLTAIHLREEIPYALTWGDGWRVDQGASPTWVSEGWFRHA